MFIRNVHETTVMTPKKAKEWEKFNCYDGQRNFSKDNGTKLKNAMLNGLFSHGDISFGETSDGKRVLVNGQHQIFACIKSGKHVMVTYSIYGCETKEDLISLYSTFNTDKGRNQQDLTKARLSSTGLKWPVALASAMVSANADIDKENNILKNRDNKTLAYDRVKCIDDEDVRKSGEVIVNLFKRYKNNRIFGKCNVLIPMFITYNANPNKFYDFWNGVVGGGFVENSDDPRSLARILIKTTSTSKNTTDRGKNIIPKNVYIAKLILCWNKWISNEKCQKTPAWTTSNFPRALR